MNQNYMDDFVCGMTCEEFYCDEVIFNEDDWDDEQPVPIPSYNIPDGHVVYAAAVYHSDEYDYENDIDFDDWSNW